MKYFALCFSFLTVVNSHTLDFNKILQVTKVMQMRNCLIACSLKESEIKMILTQDDETHWALIRMDKVKGSHLRVSGIFICIDDITQEELGNSTNYFRNARFHDWIIYGSDIKSAKKKLDIKIDERVYFLDSGQLNLSEKYTINNVTVDRLVAYLEINAEGFVLKKILTEGFIDRRSNFHGLSLTAVTKRQAPYIDFNERSLNTSSLPGNTLINISDMAQTGLFVDLLTLMKEDLNFSSNEFLRADKKFGDILISGKWEGMIGTLIDGEADMAVASLTVRSERVDAVDFLPVIAKDILGLIIKRNFVEQASWTIFLHPFSSQLWIYVFAAPLLTLVIIKCIQKYYVMETYDDCKPILSCNLVAEYWALFSSYLGRHLTGIIFEEKWPLQLILFSTFLLGSVLWMSYNGALTSLLAVRDRRLPFTSLEELLRSPYSLLITGSGFEAAQFKNATGGIFKELYKQKIEKSPEKSLAHSMESALSTLNNSKEVAFYVEFGSVGYFTEYHCQFEVSWRSAYSSELSMALPKGSPLFQFLQLNIIRHMEIGSLVRLQKNWNPGWPTCAELDNYSLGFGKLISLFTLLIVGFVTSCGVFALERIFKRN